MKEYLMSLGNSFLFICFLDKKLTNTTVMAESLKNTQGFMQQH